MPLLANCRVFVFVDLYSSYFVYLISESTAGWRMKISYVKYLTTGPISLPQNYNKMLSYRRETALQGAL